MLQGLLGAAGHLTDATGLSAQLHMGRLALLQRDKVWYAA